MEKPCYFTVFIHGHFCLKYGHFGRPISWESRKGPKAIPFGPSPGAIIDRIIKGPKAIDDLEFQHLGRVDMGQFMRRL